MLSTGCVQIGEMRVAGCSVVLLSRERRRNNSYWGEVRAGSGGEGQEESGDGRGW